MNSDKHFKVVSISAFCTVHDFADSRKLGEAILKAIDKYDGTVAVLASGSLSHRFIDDQRAEEGMNSYTREFDHQMDERVVKLWREGKFKEFCTMLPEYADYCYGEGNMHDTVMLLGLLGWDKYDGKVEFITELFASSGTGGLTPCSVASAGVRGPHAAFYRRMYRQHPRAGRSARAVRQSQRGAGRHRHLSDRRDPQPRPLAGYLADGRRQAGLRLRAYDPEDRRRAQPGEPSGRGDMLFALIKSHFATLMESRYLALSFAMEELDPTLNYKQNNVHALFK